MSLKPRLAFPFFPQKSKQKTRRLKILMGLDSTEMIFLQLSKFC